MTVNQQRVCYISWDNRKFIDIHIVDVIDKSNTSTLSSISRLNDPNVLLWIMLFQLLIVLIKFSKLIRKDVGIRNKIVVLLAKPFLHSYYIKAKSIFSSNFVALWEMIDFLVFVKTLIKITFTWWRRPKNIPFMRFSSGKPSSFKHWPYEFVVESEHLVKELTVLNMVRLLISIKLHVVGNHLLVGDILKHQEIRLVLVVIVARLRTVGLIKETVCTSMRSWHWWIHGSVRDCGRSCTYWSWAVWLNTFEFIFKFLQLAHNFTKLPLSFLLLNRAFTYSEHSLSVHEVASSWSSSILTVDTLPVLFKVRLNVLKSI